MHDRHIDTQIITGEPSAMPTYIDIHDLPASRPRTSSAPMKPTSGPGRVRRRLQALLGRRDEGKVFCLVDAPERESAARVHREAHGLEALPVEVKQGA